MDESNSYKVKSAPRSERTRHAVTNYRVKKRRATRALLELTLETGRRNQIRCISPMRHARSSAITNMGPARILPGAWDCMLAPCNSSIRCLESF